MFDLNDVGEYVILRAESSQVESMNPRLALSYLTFIGKIVEVLDEDLDSESYFKLEVMKSLDTSTGTIFTFPKFMFVKMNKKIKNILEGN